MHKYIHLHTHIHIHRYTYFVCIQVPSIFSHLTDIISSLSASPNKSTECYIATL